MRKAISVDIMRHGTCDCSNGGISSKYTTVLIEHKRGWIEFDENNPPENLVEIKKDMCMGKERIRAIPYNLIKSGKWTMMGGTFIYSCDARFHEIFNYPIPLHDRVE